MMSMQIVVVYMWGVNKSSPVLVHVYVWSIFLLITFKQWHFIMITECWLLNIQLKSHKKGVEMLSLSYF